MGELSHRARVAIVVPLRRTPLQSRRLPYPRLFFTYLRDSFIIWALLRIFIYKSGTHNIPLDTALLLSGIAVFLAWYEHRAARENFFHAGMGSQNWMCVASALVVLSIAGAFF